MKKISNRIFYTEGYLETDRPILGLILGQTRTVMVDSGNSPRHALDFKKDLRASSLPDPDFVIITHSHCDHIFGIKEMNRPTISNRLVRNRMEELQRLDWNEPALSERVVQGSEHPMTRHMLEIEYPGKRQDFIRLPDIVYDKTLELDLGGIHCRIETIGGDHSPDSALIYVPEERVLFLGDCLYLRHVTEENVHNLFQKLLSFGADFYIDSHENNMISRSQLEGKYSEYLGEANSSV